MGFHHRHSASNDSIWHGWNNFRNYSRKISYNPVPSFKFPGPVSTNPTTIAPETTTMEHITKFIKDIIMPFTSDAEVTESTIITTTQNDILNSTFPDTVGLNQNNTLNESTSSNSTVIFEIMEGTTSSSMTDMMQNESFPIDAAQNGTDLMNSLDDNNGSMLTTISEVASSTTENVLSSLSIATEKATEFVTEISGNTKSSSHDHEYVKHYHYDMKSHRLLYVILLIIIAILILIGIILLLIYIRYRRTSSRGLHNYYEVSPRKERTLSDLGLEEQKECPNEIYMHYQC